MEFRAGLFTAAMVAAAMIILSSTPALAQKAKDKSPPAPPADILPPSPAPAPSPHIVNLADLLSVAGPFHTFLDYLEKTDVLKTFQSKANDTKESAEGITIFVPKDSAFSSLRATTFANLTGEELKSLVLYHALPKYYSLAEFNKLSSLNPVPTFAGSQYTLNLTDNMGSIRVKSMWSNPKISSSVYSTRPVAVYEVDKVLLPMQIFKSDPPLAPAPAPAPVDAKADDDAALSPASGKAASAKAKAGEKSAASQGAGGGYLAVAAAGGVMMMLLW
ncbi:fasciclin-like arabinogalactan protein 7 isoform X2 [Brachypodium distachyon]|uniref:FAS1 domain-containing protein n=2 Tax=Brachypodium distachyon TaxID=15368 RepID=I1I8D7_BRADI|nr:fasciclin-like arabinogalactan protein 7 isoform X2 [Brachypodium distachyon]KQJ98886.1 hypothetical protein BRADI_3g39740v3 [Brachypodium distachyon]|eukprot:XP_003574733.1 fasciclin-like arabinogalactan protein 7 isoform X2 [Brachypodium distachyon]